MKKSDTSNSSLVYSRSASVSAPLSKKQRCIQEMFQESINSPCEETVVEIGDVDSLEDFPLDG